MSGLSIQQYSFYSANKKHLPLHLRTHTEPKTLRRFAAKTVNNVTWHAVHYGYENGAVMCCVSG